MYQISRRDDCPGENVEFEGAVPDQVELVISM
jgi:hypothetical protein